MQQNHRWPVALDLIKDFSVVAANARHEGRLDHKRRSRDERLRVPTQACLWLEWGFEINEIAPYGCVATG